MAFKIVTELEPFAGQPDALRDRAEVLGRSASGVLVPDNHTGRPRVSSLVVAHRVQG